MTGDAIDVSIVIVSWNTRDALRACLRSAAAGAPGLRCETYVVDNGSADGSAAMVRSEFPGVRLISNAANHGFAAANNQAMRHATGRYVLLLNPDTVVIGDAIANAVRIADASPRIGALGCQVLLGPDEIQQTCFRDSTVAGLLLVATGLDRRLPSAWTGGGPAMRDWDRRSARDVDVVSGMFLLARREAIAEVGLMDEAFFVYAEEADWCLRMRRAGWRCTFTPEARVLHPGGGGLSTAQDRTRMHVQLQKSVLILHRKHFGALSWLGAKAVFVASNAIRAAIWGVAGAATSRTDLRDRGRRSLAALRWQTFGTEPAR